MFGGYILLMLVCYVLVVPEPVVGFVGNSGRPTCGQNAVPSLARPSRSSSALQMVFSPKEALAIEKMKNPQKFESTIQGLMKAKRLSRAQAEKRYGEFLLDPDGFALQAAAAEREEKGYKDWKEQAIAKSADPEATRKRIDEFQKRNSIKGTAIILVFFTAVVVYGQMNPYVPPGSL
mmetsp:Transcript_22321/g.33229  ORF Transcript_22321/g.33229 Transcript_22321/m.33229 type:complete len:177 (-) Transcript_22321:1257-1787(-)